MENNAIVVKNLYKSFRLPHEKHTALKHSVINIFNTDRGYEKQQVLNDVSFEIKKGEFFGIVGRNGSGKSTLLKLLAGIYTPDSGLIEVNGVLTPFIELGVGFNPELTGRENIFMNGAILGFSRMEMVQMYDGIVEFAELENFMDQKLKNYSSGMQVRLAFSIAIQAKSDILLIDEVLAVGDAAFQQKCFSYFEKLREEGKTVILVSHDMAAITRFCDRAIYLKDGNLIEDASASEIAETYKLENIEAPKKENGLTLSKSHKLEAKMDPRFEPTITLNFTYESGDNTQMYIGFSVLKDGISVAEMTSSLDKPLTDKGSVSYGLDTSLFNAGVYQVTSVLCRVADRKLFAISKRPITFIVRGNDVTRGGALKLSDNWEY